MTGIIDYGAGNLQSVVNALKYLGSDYMINDQPAELSRCDRLILPGVGAFHSAMSRLSRLGLDTFIRERAERGVPLLGICLGMQLLFEYGNEINRAGGLGILRGEVRKIHTEFKLPHIGWNSLKFVRECPVISNIPEGAYMYFVHSFMCDCGDSDDTVSVCGYGEPVTAIVHRGSVFGCQFHPEKSGGLGIGIIRNFIAYKRTNDADITLD